MSSFDLNPIRNAQAWDVVTIAGHVSPGICKLSGFKRAFGWDIKKGKGAKGSTSTLNTYPPCEGTITFQLWTEKHFEEWTPFRGLLMVDTTKKPITALDIYHPALADIDLTSVVCKSISAISPTGKGMYEITIELLEYNPPPKKPAVSTPVASETRGPAVLITEYDKPLTDEERLKQLEKQRDAAVP